MTKVLIGTPAYGGVCCTAYTESLLYTIKLLESQGVETTVHFINNQLVTRARNMICSIFMNDETYTHLLFIDSDIQWDPKHVLYLLEHNKECVIGVYPNKAYVKKDTQLVLRPSSGFFVPTIEDGDLVKVEFAATGFMLLKNQL